MKTHPPLYLLLAITGHGLGHLAQCVPVIQALRSQVPLRLWVRSALPEAVLTDRLGAIEAIDWTDDEFGMVMADATTIDQAATAERYRALHARLPHTIKLLADRIAANGIDVVLSNVSYLATAAAAATGVPAVAFCSLTWHEILGAYFPAMERVRAEMLNCYRQATCILRLEPGMPFAGLPSTTVAQPIARVGTARSAELRRWLRIGADRPVALLSFSVLPATLPRLVADPNDFVLVGPAAWQDRNIGCIETAPMPYHDLLASVDVVVSKAGYGTTAELGCSGIPAVLVDRPDWPEQSYLVAWLRAHGRCLMVPDMESVTAAALQHCMQMPIPNAIPSPGGEWQIAEAVLRSRARSVPSSAAPSEVATMSTTPFSLSVPDSAIDDLRERLARTRFPDQAPGEPWAYGTNVDYLRSLIEYWRTGFDWRAQEARLNAFPQFTTALHDIDVHYVHVPGKGPNPTPLLLMHGWPGSVFEFLELIPRLTDPARFGGDPADALSVIAPSLPGYGLSFHPGQKRFGIEEIADCLTDLMTETLGYRRFAAQGGDWGGITAARLGYAHADKLIGIHVNFLGGVRRDPEAIRDTAPESRLFREQLAYWQKEETGYISIQGTKPQTLSFGLTDSPAGLAAWIMEKFRTWSDCDGDVESVFSRDELLANISLYWFTGAIGSSFFPYYFRLHRPWPIPEDGTVSVPTGYSEFPHEILRPPQSLAARTYTDIRRWTVMPRGGHFAAMEQPAALADDVLAFFRMLR